MKKVCGGCNFQGDNILENQCKRILCLFDNQLHKETDTCTHWYQYSYNMSRDERLRIASDVRNSEEAERRHHESLKSAEINRNVQVKIAILSFVFGIWATLITQWVMDLWK